MKCADCQRDIDQIDVFPKGRCVDCHAKAPEVIRELSTMTAEKLARMWGAT
jgi:hypothetical protein